MNKGSGGGNNKIKQLKSQVAALQQLLEVYEKAAVEQTARLEQALEDRERLLREADAQRRLFQTVIENAPVGIALLRGPDFVFEIANPAYQAIAPGKTFLGKSVAEAWPELASQVLPLLERVLHTGEPYSTVDAPFLVQRMPGAPLETVYFSFSYIPLPSVEGMSDVILVLVIETTKQVQERERTEELAREAQRRAAELQGVIDNMIDGVFVCDVEGRITLVNDAAARLLGISSPEEVKPALVDFPSLLSVRHLDGRPFAPEELPLARALAGEMVFQDDEIVLNRQIKRDLFLRVSAAPIRNEAGQVVGAVAVARDVTELTELDRLKDQFIEVAAHELKTPVTVIRGFSQLLLEREHRGISPQGLRALEAIDRQSGRITGLINDLLDISRLQTGRLELARERIDLLDLVEEAINRAALTTTKHRLRIVKAQPAVVKGDRGRLEQVLANLLDNAIKFSPQGGDIDIEVSIEDREAVVSVTDHGVGIPKEKQRHLFERFYRAHTGTPYDYGGMGVGLYISKEIITRQGGRMWFKSEEGKGSTFYFALPLA